MGLLTWAIAKSMGHPSPGERCEELARAFLAKNNIVTERWGCLTGEKCTGNPRFNRRVYHGYGTRNSKDVGFFIEVDEDLCGTHGAIVKSGSPTYAHIWYKDWLHESRQYRSMGLSIASNLYYYLVKRAGGAQEELELTMPWALIKE